MIKLMIMAGLLFSIVAFLFYLKDSKKWSLFKLITFLFFIKVVGLFIFVGVRL